MKKNLTILLLFLAVAVRSQTNISVVYSFLNGAGQPQFVKQFSFTSMSLGSYSNAYVVGDEIFRVVTGLRYTNAMLSGFAYRIKFYKDVQPPVVTAIFTNYFPTNLSGIVFATDWTAISTNLGNGIYAYSMAQADARFAPIGGGYSTNLIRWGIQHTNSSVSRAATIYFYFPTNSLSPTNFPYSVVTTN